MSQVSSLHLEFVRFYFGANHVPRAYATLVQRKGRALSEGQGKWRLWQRDWHKTLVYFFLKPMQIRVISWQGTVRGAVHESQIKSPLEKYHADAVVNFLLRIACQVKKKTFVLVQFWAPMQHKNSFCSQTKR